MENYHIILVRSFLGKDLKQYVRIESQRFKEIVRIPYTYSRNKHQCPIKEAKKFLESKGFNIVGQGELRHDHALLSDTFNSIKIAHQ